ncbi:MAG TPA: hypothetical protein VFY14_22525 [Streptomyces sp.]|nr:hypothetical protein [Streptomyces sp.]
MSRETDSPSSGPQTRSGAAYPPGTEPYGTPADSAANEPAAQPGEPKTETTLTTRIRINIPGSRPIPPVVVCTPVSEAGEAGETGKSTAIPSQTRGGEDGAAAKPAVDVSAMAQGANGTAGASKPSGPGGSSGGGRQTSSWFAPRKPPAAGGTSGSGLRSPLAQEEAPAQQPGRTDTPPYGFPADTAELEAIGPLQTTAPFGAGQPEESPQGPGHTPPHGFPAAVMRPAPEDGPSGPTTGPATGEMPLLPPAFQRSEPSSHLPETGPQAAVSDLGGPAPTGDGPGFSADTLVGGMAAVRPSDDGREVPQDEGYGVPDPEPDPVPARRGRSRLVLVGVAAFGVLGAAYGAGLLLDHADVPNGTTVLGVEIGGTNKQEATGRLDAVLGKRAKEPLVLDVDGAEKTLKPSVAGLVLDTETTVRNASGRDYNPISVIGSLIGGSRHAEPVFTVDTEKLTAALEDLSGESPDGAARDGMVKFVDGKAVGVPGEPHRKVDVTKGADLLEEAYRRHVATGRSTTVKLPVSLQQPEVDQKEIDRAIREFGEPAMSGMVTVRAGDVSLPFSPTGSLPKFLSMKPVNGKLVDTYDLETLKELYGTTFDGILITRGNGTKTPVTPQDVAGALREALRETDPAKRVGVIELDPQ